jgi:hypothetical protein
LFPDKLFPIILMFSGTQRKHLVLGHALVFLQNVILRNLFY